MKRFVSLVAPVAEWTPEMHLRSLAEFIKGVELAGGTTPHVTMTVAAMAEIEDPLEKLWFAGCYALTYNYATAERIWLEWRPSDLNQIDFLLWAEEHWSGIFLRKERKAVFRKSYFAESAATYLAFSRRLLETPTWPDEYLAGLEMFTGGCRFMGRYIGIRWMEVMRRAFDLPGWAMSDIRSDGGEHPRKALALIYPEDAAALLGGNSRQEIAVADAAADRCLVDLEIEYGIYSNYYELQSLLCEYKQSALGRKHFPGKSIDSEQAYFGKISAYWGTEGSHFYPIRAVAFPAWSLGEVAGWAGNRPELGAVLADYGYTWSDAVYDYNLTTDLSHPVLRAGGRAAILL